MGELVDTTLTQLVTDPNFDNAPSWTLVDEATIAGGILTMEVKEPAPYCKCWNLIALTPNEFYVVEVNVLSNDAIGDAGVGITLGSGAGHSLIGIFTELGIGRRFGQAGTIPDEFWLGGSKIGVLPGTLEIEYAKLWKLSDWCANHLSQDFPGMTFVNVTILKTYEVMVQLVNETTGMNLLVKIEG